MKDIELEYNQKIEPQHHLKIQERPGLQLKQVESRKLGSDVLSVKFDHDGDYLAMGCKNGTKLLYNVAHRRKILSEALRQQGESRNKLKMEAKYIGKEQDFSSCRCVYSILYSGGYVTFHHMPTLKPLLYVYQQHNAVHTVDFSPSAKRFATGGKDFHVRIYDQDTKTVQMDFKPAGWNNVGHDNRVFSVKFIDQYTVISGGWDSVVHIWDLRQGKSVKHFYGPNISGESLDYSSGKILAGCYSANNQLQVWDIVGCKKLQEIDWTGDIDDAQYIYCASFSRRDPQLFAAGSTGPNSSVRFYREISQESPRYQMAGQIKQLSSGCFSFDFANKTDKFAFTTPHHGFYLFQYSKAH